MGKPRDTLKTRNDKLSKELGKAVVCIKGKRKGTHKRT